MDDKHELVKKMKEMHKENGIVPSKEELIMTGVSDYRIRMVGGYNKLLDMAGLESRNYAPKARPPEVVESKPLRILVLDIETAPILAAIWRLWGDMNVGINMIDTDWYVMAWAAKWVGEDHVYYQDQRGKSDMENDYDILLDMWKLIDEADVVVTQNGVAFDIKKLFARFIILGMKKPSSFRNWDLKIVCKNLFGFTSNKLEYITEKLNTKYKKLKHSKFPGYELWRECLKNNLEAWQEMEKYNKHDVLSLEESYLIVRSWRNSINFNVPLDSEEPLCVCGSTNLKHSGFIFSNLGKYDRYTCEDCGCEHQGRQNLLSKYKRKSLLK